MEPKFEDYLGTLSTNMDYAFYLVNELVKEGNANQLSHEVGSLDIIEIEKIAIELINKIQKVRGKRR
tara:strand:- start:44 stop:244 length:201 start_codon:yes stop_codon:yes gene_type:complete